MNAYELKDKLDKIAPFSISEKLKAIGYYDNSGVIFNGESDKVIATLDLTYGTIEYAKYSGCNLILTHHPVIFSPVTKIEGVLAECVKNSIGIVSAHLNADFAQEGVDYHFAKLLGAVNETTLENYNFGTYGRFFRIKSQTLQEYSNFVSEKLNCKNVCVFGNKNGIVNSVASFCGAGVDEKTIALAKNADVIVSADIKHHLLLQLVEQGKSVIMPTHYATENYGFKQICVKLSKLIKEKVLYYEESTLL